MSLDPTLAIALQQFYNSDPGFASEYARHMAQARPGTDARTNIEWLYDFLKDNPEQIQRFKSFADNSTTEVTTGGGEEIPLEQELLERFKTDYLYPELDRDKQRQAEGQSILDRYNNSIDQAIAQNNKALDGSRLQEEYAMADDVANRFRTAAGDQASGQVVALDKLNSERLSALDPLAKERIALADTKVSGINQALERERDRIDAADAMSGFIGGSSMKDSTLARASFGARQDAAETMGAAKVQNADDTRGIWDATAQGKAGAEFGRLSGVNTADQNLATNRKAYFDNDFTRRLAAALTPATLETNRLQFRGAVDDYGRSGLKDALSTLNWWSTNPVQPNFNTFQQTANTAGNSLATLGAGITSAGLNFLTSKKPAAPEPDLSWGAPT